MINKDKMPGWETLPEWDPFVTACLKELDELPFEVELVQIKEKFCGLRVYYRVEIPGEYDDDDFVYTDENMEWKNQSQDRVDAIIEKYEKLVYEFEKASRETS